MGRLKFIGEFLALRCNTTLLLALTGERLWLNFASKYLETLGVGIFVNGLFNALLTLLGALYNFPGGWLNGSLGTRQRAAASS